VTALEEHPLIFNFPRMVDAMTAYSMQQQRRANPLVCSSQWSKVNTNTTL
jgi:hypothetical protein